MRKKLALLLAMLLLLSTTGIYSAAAVEIWTAQVSGTTEWLTDVDFVDVNTGWAVGTTGTILNTTDGGASWTAQVSDTTQSFMDVDFVDANTGWAVGDDIIVKTTDGGFSWTDQTSGWNLLYGVYFLDANTGWAVGYNWGAAVGTILKTTDGGDNWTAQSAPGVLQDVNFVNSSTGWAVGSGGTILKTTNGGSSWTAQTSGTSNMLLGVHFIDANTGWAVGQNGTILKTTNSGTTWTTQTSGTANRLFGVHFVDSSTGWAVGLDGIILKTTDGGTTWATQTSGTTERLWDVHFIDANTGWAVGEAGTILKTTDEGGGDVSVNAQVPAGLAQLTFSIAAQTAPAGGSVTTDALDFGTLEANTPKTGSQRLTVSTNALAGYSVSAEEDTPLTAGTDSITDTVGDNSLATESATDTWGSSTTYGFGYSLADVSGTDAAFTSGYKQFADKSSAETEQAVMANTGAVTANQVDVLYKVNIGPSQPQGSYANNLTYIAVGNF